LQRINAWELVSGAQHRPALRPRRLNQLLDFDAV
jgi:hypothetical protein